MKEIEDALLRGDIDLAVHSSKDMPAVLPDGLTIAGVLPREDPLDAVVLPAGAAGPHGRASVATIDELVARLGQSPSIGTGSVRRIAQLTRLFPGARFAPIRGNLDTRLRKLDDGEHDALVLAAAGLRRLGFGHRISLALPADGVRAGARSGHRRDRDPRRRRRGRGMRCARIDDPAAAAALDAERARRRQRSAAAARRRSARSRHRVDDDELELIARGRRARRQPRRSAAASARSRERRRSARRRVGAQLLPTAPTRFSPKQPRRAQYVDVDAPT